MPKFVTLIGSVHQTVALKAAVKKPTMYARKIKALARNVLSMMTVTLGAASLEHAHLTLRATMKSWGFHKPRLRSMKRLKLMARLEKTSTVLLIGSVLQTVAFWEAAKSLTSCARMIEGWARNVLSMMTVTLGAASLEHAHLTLRATMKSWGFHKPRLRSMKRLKLMARLEKTSTVLLIGSVLQTVAFWEAAKSLTSCVRMIEGWARNVLLMMTATLGAASLEHARLILRATMKAPLLKSNKLKRYPTLSLKKNLKCVE